MKLQPIFATLLFLSLCLISCDEDFFSTTITLDPPEHTPRLVVHAFNTTENTLIAQITRTTALSEVEINGDDRFVYDAIATLYKEDQLIGELELFADPINQNFYNYYLDINENFEEGINYTLVVNHPDFSEVRSTVQMPKASIILDTEFIFEGGLDETGSPRSAIDVKINDLIGKRNFYEVSISRGGTATTYVSSLDPSVSRSLNYDDVIISDASFDGEEKILRLQIGKSNQDNRFVAWRDISEAHYIYSKTMRSSFDVGENPFTSPVQIKGNIENGFGLFSLMNLQVIEVN